MNYDDIYCPLPLAVASFNPRNAHLIMEILFLFPAGRVLGEAYYSSGGKREKGCVYYICQPIFFMVDFTFFPELFRE